MDSHRRLLWLTVMLAGLAAAVLYLSGTASAESGSTDSPGADTSNATTTTSTTTSTNSATDTAEAQQSPGTTTSVATSPATKPSSLESAITQAREARSAAAQLESEAQTPDPTPNLVARSPAVRAFEIDAGASRDEKTDDPKPTADPATRSPAVRAFEVDTAPSSADKRGEPKPAESIAAASPADSTPRQPLAAVVADVLSEVATSAPQDPQGQRHMTATAGFDDVVVTPVVVEDKGAALINEGGPPAAAAALGSSPEVTNPLAASIPSALAPTAVDGVVVGQSTLAIPCGPGYEVPADWYFPTGADPPAGMIWLQHGFLAQGPWYSTTAAILAKETNSIVVAPSITSNFLQCDGCWLNGDPMESAVASMLVDRTELAESARQAAGIDITLPDTFVLVGHSAGGGFAVAVAGLLAGTSAYDNLAGVVMFDGVALNTSMATSLTKIPDLPVYQIAAPSYIWNNLGSGTAQLVQARPGQFVGFQLAGGSHVDAMRGNPLIEFAAQLLTGFSRPGNFQAIETLASGWINDMYDPHAHQGIYAAPGQTINIGKATATSLPTPPTWFTPVERLLRKGLLIVEQFLFGSFNHPVPVSSQAIAA